MQCFFIFRPKAFNVLPRRRNLEYDVPVAAKKLKQYTHNRGGKEKAINKRQFQ
jgi:hypothetical protein